MTGIQFVTDEKGRKVAVQIDLKKYGALLEDFWDGLISQSRRHEKGIPLEETLDVDEYMNNYRAEFKPTGASQAPGHNRLLRPIVVLISLLLISIAHAQERPCTREEELRALDEADTPRSWDALYKSYKLYRQCDDGAIAEGYSESVVRILVDHWSTLPRPSVLVRRDARFRRFVVNHVDPTVNCDDLRKIRINANTLCPRSLGTLCADLAKEADDALKECPW
jgi:hypothetical protein